MNLTVFINHHTNLIYANDPVLVFSTVGKHYACKDFERVMASCQLCISKAL